MKVTNLSQQNKNSYTFIMVITFFAAIAGLLFGFDTGIISGALQFVSITFHITHGHQGLQELIVSAVPLGAFFGAVLSKKSSFVLGRRWSIIATAILFIVGTLVASVAVNISMLIVGRLIMGLGVGLSSMIVPMYLSEISPPEIRGAIVFCFQLAITVGLFMSFVINLIFSDMGSWRLMFAIGLIPSIVLGVGMLFFTI